VDIGQGANLRTISSSCPARVLVLALLPPILLAAVRRRAATGGVISIRSTLLRLAMLFFRRYAFHFNVIATAQSDRRTVHKLPLTILGRTVGGVDCRVKDGTDYDSGLAVCGWA